MVFPRSSVLITHAGCRPLVADPNVVVFYNPRQRYRRSKISEEGDRGDWFGVRPRAVIDARRPFEPHVDENPDRAFPFNQGPVDAEVYFKQRLVIEHVTKEDPVDSLFVEEEVLRILGDVVRAAYVSRGFLSRENRDPDGATLVGHARIVAAAKAVLNTSLRSKPGLDQLAERLEVSPFHLCRIFREQTGLSIHRYLNQVRLRRSLEQVAEGTTDLAAVALDLGYSSHSHFTMAFRRAFGTTPSALRKCASANRLRDLTRRLRV